MTTTHPARLHVLLARDAAVGVVFRRGPARRVCVIGWDRARDRFQIGQWLKGRIYERRSDLSPDGKFLIYFAGNHKFDSATKGTWTAISRAPYLKAVGLWGKGDSWNGGGLFVDNRTVWLNHGYGQSEMTPQTRFEQTPVNPFPGGCGNECLGVYYPRLIRDGWIAAGSERYVRTGRVDMFDKPVGHGWVLRKRAHATSEALPVGAGCYFDRHELAHPTHCTVSGVGWEWADVDGDRLVWAAGGRLYAGRVSRTGLTVVTQLYDFNPLAFTNIRAPY